MFRTKKDVDKHCQEIFKKFQSEKDKNLRGLSIAQQYYNVRDYKSAKQYVMMYLSVKDNSAIAHKLLAQCYEYFGDKEKALAEYKYSLQLDPKQSQLILKICELLADSSILVDKTQIKYWYEKGENHFPYHPTVFKLKQKIFFLEDNKNTELDVLDELKTNPNNPALHVLLLTFYIENRRVKEAYDKAFSKNFTFLCNVQWTQCGVKICELYKIQFPTSLNEEFYAKYLLVLERSLALAVQDIKITRKSIPECITFLCRFDEILSEASALINKTEQFLHLINHMCGQLCFHTANILYRKVKWEDCNWPEMIKLITPLLLLSTAESFSIRHIKLDSSFYHILKPCIQFNIYRISQAGFILLSMTKHEKHFIEKIFHFCVANYWREHISKKIYGSPEYATFLKSSFFMNYAAFSKLPSELLNNLVEDIDNIIQVTEAVEPSSLHHLVWLGVQCLSVLNKESICNILLPLKFSVGSLNSLQFSQNSITSNYAESLCKLDIDAFLYACVYCAKSAWDYHIDSNKPQSLYVLPADVSKLLCSPEHRLWWEYAYQMVNKTVEENNFSRTRSVLQRGIEIVRLVGNSYIPVQLLVLLGRTFADRATVESNSDRASALESRALLYWKAALPTLEKIVHNESFSSSSKSFFEYFGKIISKNEAIKLVAECKRYIGMQLVKEKNYSESMFENENDDYINDEILIESPKLNLNSTDDKMLQKLYEQNIKIMDKLETLFNKQELLSSNQLQLFETITMLSNKIEDILIIPNECNFDGMSGALSSLSQNTVSVANQSNINLDNKCNLSVSNQSNFGSTRPLVSSNIQTNFPMYPFTHSSLPLPTNNPLTSMYWPGSPCLNSTALASNVTPTHFQLPSSFLNKCSSDSKESSSRVSRTMENIVSNMEPLNFESMITATSSFTFGRDFSTSLTAVEAKNLHEDAVIADNVISSKTALFSSPNVSSCISSIMPSPIIHSFQIPVPNESSIVQSPSVQIPNECEESDEEKIVEHDPIPDFKPIIPLPDEVDVKTGEEDEEVLFENRAKLFRFANKEWKERGIGMIKILKNPNTGKIRILMRREIVHKICANHFLTEDMNLTPMFNNDKAWIYCAPDFSDETLKIEKFCVKFKTVEIAQEFHHVFNIYKSANAKLGKTESSDKTSEMTNSVFTLNTVSSLPVKTDDKSQKKSIINPPIMKVENENNTEITSDFNKTALGGFTFTSKPVVNAILEEKEPEKEEKKKTPFASFTGFSLGSLSQTETESKLFQSKNLSVESDTNESCMFSSVKNIVDFSSLSKNTSETTAFAKSKDFKGFVGAGSLVFGAKSTTSKPNDTTSVLNIESILKNVPKRNESIESTSTTQSCNVRKEESSASHEDEFIPTAEFQPVIPLPDLIEIKTGEEGLEVIYEGQCKLFRFVTNEWKERGVGKMKILQDPVNGSIRLLMRRDQVHKVCCNQRLTVDHELKPLKTTDKAWSWYAQDFSEGELQNEFLCVRFKTSDLANEFKKAFDKAKSMLSNTKGDLPTASEKSENAALPSLSEMFKRDQNSWECKMCYVINKMDENYCTACSQVKPGTSDEVKSSQSNIKFTFGFSNSSEADHIKSSSNLSNMNNENKNLFKFSSVTTSVSSSPLTFSFGNVSKSITSNSNIFNFGTQKDAQKNIDTSFTFTSPVSSENSSTPFKDKAIFSFGNPIQPKSESGGFFFGSDKSNNSPNELTNNQTPQTKKENEMKNFNIFTGKIFADDVVKSSNNSGAFANFSFKLEDKMLINQTKSSMINQTVESNQNEVLGETGNNRSATSDEVEFISETKISEEEKQLAESLMLPTNYFSYKYNNKVCPGCIGCDQEDNNNEFKLEKEDSSETKLTKKTTESIEKIKENQKTVTNSINSFSDKVSFVFGESGENTSRLPSNSFNFGKIFNQSIISAGDASSEKNTTEEESDSEKEASVVSNDHEPYFEPVIALPTIVETKTGEEDEIVEFCERSKIFRFDENNKEWKERGVGELKVLYHPVQKSYRLLLRREQVHKVVLNQRITSSLNLQPLSSSKNSLCWFGMNFLEEHNESVVEKLAARFKTEEILEKFQRVVTKCLSLMNTENGSEEKFDKNLNNTSAKSNDNDKNENNVENVEDNGYVNYEKNEYEDEESYNEYDNNEDYEKHENEFYVDEQGIEDAMVDVDEDSEIIFNSNIILQIFEDDSAAEYDGVLCVIKEEDTKPYIVFSTSEIQSFYKADVENTICSILSDNSVSLINNESEFENNTVLRFSNPELAEEFLCIYEMMKTV